MNRVGESNSAFPNFGFFGIDIHWIKIDPIEKTADFDSGFGHCFDYRFPTISKVRILGKIQSNFIESRSTALSRCL
jgi:hypothetical protein